MFCALSQNYQHLFESSLHVWSICPFEFLGQFALIVKKKKDYSEHVKKVHKDSTQNMQIFGEGRSTPLSMFRQVNIRLNMIIDY